MRLCGSMLPHNRWSWSWFECLECEEAKVVLPCQELNHNFLDIQPKVWLLYQICCPWCGVCHNRSIFHLLHCVCCGTNGVVESAVNVVPPMLIYSFTNNENLYHDLHTILMNSEHGVLINMKIILFFFNHLALNCAQCDCSWPEFMWVLYKCDHKWTAAYTDMRRLEHRTVHCVHMLSSSKGLRNCHCSVGFITNTVKIKT